MVKAAGAYDLYWIFLALKHKKVCGNYNGIIVLPHVKKLFESPENYSEKWLKENWRRAIRLRS